jgi:antitoxin ParD1/3/4
MSTVNVSLPDALEVFVDEQVAERGYASSSEYVRELIRVDQEPQRLRRLLLDGAASPPGGSRRSGLFRSPARSRTRGAGHRR